MNSKKGSYLRRDLIIPAGLLILNLILRMLFLDSRDLAMDEPFTVFYSQSDLHSIFRMLATENNPPLYFLILHFWIKIFGISVFSVRFLSCIFSSLAVLAIWLIGRKFCNERVALIASLLYTFSNYEMIFAHEARVYSLFALLSSLSFFFFLSMIQNPVRKKYWILLAVTNVLLVYSHFFGFMVILTQGICLVASKEVRGNAGANFSLTVIVALASFIPYVPVTLSRFAASSGGTWIPVPVISDLYTMVWRFSNAPVVTVFFIMILAAAGLLWLTRSFRSKNKMDTPGRTIALWFFFPYLFLFFISFRLPVFLDRYLIFLTPAWFLLIAMAIDRLDYRKWTSYALAVIAVLSMAVTFKPNADNKRRIREAVGIVEALKKENVPVIICPEWLKFGFAYYHDRKIFEDYRNLDARLKGEGIYPVNGLEKMDPGLFKRSDGIVYFEEWATLVDKDNRILGELQKNFPSCRSWKVYESYSVFYFSR